MHTLLGELRERLLRAGVAPRHVRRYLTELSDHFADLTAEQEAAGMSRSDAKAIALARLGSVDGLTKAMTSQAGMQSLTARAPWLTLGVVPVGALAAAWFIAFFILWSGWKMFLPGAVNPFVPIHGFAIPYFGIGRWIYFLAPFLAGWAITFTAARQRCTTLWPALGLILVALLGGVGQVRVTPPSGSAAAGHVSLNFALGASAHNTLYGMTYAWIILSVITVPYLVWRMRQVFSN